MQKNLLNGASALKIIFALVYGTSKSFAKDLCLPYLLFIETWRRRKKEEDVWVNYKSFEVSNRVCFELNQTCFAASIDETGTNRSKNASSNKALSLHTQLAITTLKYHLFKFSCQIIQRNVTDKKLKILLSQKCSDTKILLL